MAVIAMDPLLDVVRLKWQDVVEFFDHCESIADKRTKDWLYVGSPRPMLTWSILYLLMVWLGPKYMRHRKPFELKYLMIVYNLSMSFLNGYIAFTVIISATALNYSYICQPVTNSTDPQKAAHELAIASALWWYFFSKLLEYTDTAIFIARKKDSQLTFLHCYHHSTMFALWWIGVKWVPGGSPFLMAMLNSSVHVIMYLYYGLSAIGPSINKYLWWKKYLTILQLAQFFLALTMGCLSLLYPCDFPMWMSYILVVYMVSFIILFSNFYYHAYTKGKRNRGARADSKILNGRMHLDSNGRMHLDSNGRMHQDSNGHMHQESNGHLKSHACSNGYASNTVKDHPTMKEMHGQTWLHFIFSRSKAKRQ